jgi:hypothetical protein
LEDLQLTAVSAFFLAAKNSMLEPFSLEHAMEFCYNKYSMQQFLEKERQIQDATLFVTDRVTTLDFLSHYVRVARFKFCQSLTKSKGGWPRRVIKSSSDFFKELEVFSFELCKFHMADAMAKQYSRPYLAAGILLVCFETLVSKIVEDNL